MAERFPGPHARDAHREGLGDDYARDGEWSGAGRHDDYVRETTDDPDVDAEIADEVDIDKASE